MDVDDDSSYPEAENQSFRSNATRIYNTCLIGGHRAEGLSNVPPKLAKMVQEAFVLPSLPEGQI